MLNVVVGRLCCWGRSLSSSRLSGRSSGGGGGGGCGGWWRRRGLFGAGRLRGSLTRCFASHFLHLLLLDLELGVALDTHSLRLRTSNKDFGRGAIATAQLSAFATMVFSPKGTEPTLAERAMVSLSVLAKHGSGVRFRLNVDVLSRFAARCEVRHPRPFLLLGCHNHDKGFADTLDGKLLFDGGLRGKVGDGERSIDCQHLVDSQFATARRLASVHKHVIEQEELVVLIFGAALLR